MKHKIEYLGVKGEGGTILQAKQDAATKIASMIKGDYTPLVYEYRGWIMLLWREPFTGWLSTLIATPEDGVRDNTRGYSTHADRETAIRASKRHLAQLGWTPDDDLEVPALIANDRDASREFVSWARFQLKYRELKAKGLSDTECYRQACEAV